MHVFLTGPIQIGKSTIIKKVTDTLGLKTGGFVTFFQNRECERRTLHLSPAGLLTQPSADNVVAMFSEDGLQIFPEIGRAHV